MNKIIPYDYQQDLRQNTNDYFFRQKKHSLMMQLATGGGKTIIMCLNVIDALERGLRVIILAHRYELISQMWNTLYDLTGIRAGIIHPDFPKTNNLVQVGSIQTYINRKKLPCDILIIDEAHHTPAPTYVEIMSNHNDAYHLGLTASPWRMDTSGFKKQFENILLGPPITELEKRRFIVPADAYCMPIDPNELKKISIVKKGKNKGEYDAEELSELVDTDDFVVDITDVYRRYANDKRMCIFALNVKNSKHIASSFNKVGIPAAHIDGETSQDERTSIFNKLKTGAIKVLSNVGIAKEGTNIPSIECIGLAYPMNSLVDYLQCCGRGGRKFGNKKDYILLDFGNNVLKHGLPNYEHDWQAHFEGNPNANKKVKRYIKVVDKEGKEDIIELDEAQSFPQGLVGLRMTRIDCDFRMPLFNDCLVFSERAGKSKYAAYTEFCHRLRAMQSIPSHLELIAIAKQLQYKQSWIDFEMRAWQRIMPMRAE